jgi:hypothetical protein
MIKPRRVRWAGHVAHMGMKVSACRFSVGKTEGNKLLERARLMYEDNTKTDCEIGSGVWLRIGTSGGLL